MKRILLPTDFSKNAWNAIDYALQLFAQETCHFLLLHTYTPMILSWDALSSSPTQMEILEDIKETYDRDLEELLENITSKFQNPKHTYSTLSSFNTLPLEINEINQREPLDLVIMGTQGATGLKRVLFGSNTIHVLKNATCPVMAIPSSYSFEKPSEVLFPSDFLVPFQQKQLQPVLEIASQYNARLNILHIKTKGELSEQQLNNKHQLTELFKNEIVLFHEMEASSVPEAISEFQFRSKMDLLVLIKNKHSFFTNLFYKPTIERIGFHLNVPFLMIPTS